MVGTKTQDVKSDKETIIDMEPVNKEQKKTGFKNFNFIFFVSSLFVVIIITLWLIFYYLPNFYQLKNNKIDDLVYRIGKLESLEKKSDNTEIKKLNLVIESLRNQIKEIDIDLIKSSLKEIEILKEEISLINNEIQKNPEQDKIEKLTSQIIDHSSDIQINEQNLSAIKNIKKVETPFSSEEILLKKAKVIVEKLLERKDFASSTKEEFYETELDTFQNLKNYLAGFLKLRQFSDNSSPRALITRAELELENRNLKKFLDLIKQLPDNWKKPVNSFIIEAENSLNLMNNEGK